MELALYYRQRGWTKHFVDDLFTPMVNEWQEGPLIDAEDSEVDLLAVSPDGKYMAVSYLDKSYGIWSFEQEKWVLNMTGSAGSFPTTLVFSPDGSQLAAGTADGIVNVRSIPGGRPLYALKNHPGRIHTVQFSPDGTELLVGTRNEIWVWRRGDGNIQRVNILKYRLPQHDHLLPGGLRTGLPAIAGFLSYTAPEAELQNCMYLEADTSTRTSWVDGSGFAARIHGDFTDDNRPPRPPRVGTRARDAGRRNPLSAYGSACLPLKVVE